MVQIFVFFLVIFAGITLLEAIGIFKFQNVFRLPRWFRKPTIEDMIAELEENIRVESDLLETAEKLCAANKRQLDAAHKTEATLRQTIKSAESDEIALPYAERLQSKLKEIANLEKELAHNKKTLARHKANFDSKSDLLARAREEKDSIVLRQKLKDRQGSKNSIENLKQLIDDSRQTKEAEAIVDTLLKENPEEEADALLEKQEAQELMNRIRS